jgi:flagellar biosynthesis/type III secretory pathway chaperone
MPSETAKELIQLLDKERLALNTGAFDDLDQLSGAKTILFENLTRADSSAADLALIKHKVSENQKLLAAAIRGVSAARERLAALENVRGGLAVYDRDGQLAKVPTSKPALQKKA